MSRSMALGGLQLTSPVWAGDYLDRNALLPGGVKVLASAFNVYTANVTATLTADAAAGATSIVPAALSAPIPAGTVLSFGLPGLFAVTTLAAASGAIVIQTLPLQRALTTGMAATFLGSSVKSIPNGTVVGRTYAERDAGTPFGPAAATDDEITIIAFDVSNADEVNDAEVLRPHSHFVVKENFLPNYAGILADADLLAALRARFNCTIGQP